jgi:thiamine-phosphate pyrophosphorylase
MSVMRNEKPPVAGAAVVCLRDGCVLLARRAHEPSRGRWSFPGGKIRAGETARRAAEREALEETGLRVRTLEVVDVYDALFPPFHYCVADYLSVPLDAGAEPLAGSDALDARWVPFDEFDEYDPTPAMRCVLQRARWMLDHRDESPPALGLERTVAPTGISLGHPQRERICGLYVITDAHLQRHRSHDEIAAAALAGGARIIQLRDKSTDAGMLLPAARAIRERCRGAGALFIINDRIDLALAAGADGVHLGQTDLPVEIARRILGSERLIGVSVENVVQVRRAEAEGADYLGVGPVYGSATKADAGAPVGPAQIRDFSAATTLPIVAIGGITLERVPEVLAAGAASTAVIGAVVSAPDMEAAARALAAAASGEAG